MSETIVDPPRSDSNLEWIGVWCGLGSRAYAQGRFVQQANPYDERLGRRVGKARRQVVALDRLVVVAGDVSRELDARRRVRVWIPSPQVRAGNQFGEVEHHGILEVTRANLPGADLCDQTTANSAHAHHHAQYGSHDMLLVFLTAQVADLLGLQVSAPTAVILPAFTTEYGASRKPVGGREEIPPHPPKSGRLRTRKCANWLRGSRNGGAKPCARRNWPRCVSG